MFVATFLVFGILPNMVWIQTTQANLTCYFPFNYNGKNYTTCTTNGYGFPWCSPTPIFSGKIINCTANISQPCLNNGTYILTSMGLFTCRCSPSYTGLFCQTRVNPCLSNPCITSNTISCQVPQNSMKNFICICRLNYIGIRCEIPCAKDTICLDRTVEYELVTTTPVDTTIRPKLFPNFDTMIIVSSTISGGTLIIGIICAFFCYRHQNKKSNSPISTQSGALQISEAQQQPTYAQALYDRALSTIRSTAPTPSNISYAHTYEEIGSVYTPEYLASAIANQKISV